MLVLKSLSCSAPRKLRSLTVDLRSAARVPRAQCADAVPAHARRPGVVARGALFRSMKCPSRRMSRTVRLAAAYPALPSAYGVKFGSSLFLD